MFLAKGMSETLLEGLVMLLPWFREDRKMYQVSPDNKKWFKWGYIETGNYDGSKFWYILLRLPSYSYKLRIWDDNYGPHQAAFLYKAGIPSGEGKWSLIDIPL